MQLHRHEPGLHPVQASLDRLLVPPTPTAAAEALQGYLKLVTEAFKRTMALAESLQEVVGQAANVADLANAAFSETLGDYPQLELQWLRLLHQSKASLVCTHKAAVCSSFLVFTTICCHCCSELCTVRHTHFNCCTQPILPS